MSQRLVLNKDSYFGSGAVSHLSEKLKKNNYERILVVTDAELVTAKIIQRITSILAKNRIVYQVFDRVYHNPTVANVKSGVEMVKQFRADALIAVGGGSVIDAAKAIALMCANPEITDVRKLEGDAGRTKNPAMPLIAIPTNMASGAESSVCFMLSDMNNQRKITCRDTNCLPDTVIVDTDFGSTVSAKQTALDAAETLALAIEGFISAEAWSMTDFYNISAIHEVVANVKSAVKNSAKAKEQLFTAQYIAGVGASNSGLGLLHSMAHALEVCYDVPHAAACAILLVPVLTFNASGSGAKYKDIAQALGARVSDKASPADYRKTCINSVEKLFKELGLPKKLKDIGVSIKDADFLAECVVRDFCIKQNPKEVSKRKVLEIYKSIA